MQRYCTRSTTAIYVRGGIRVLRRSRWSIILSFAVIRGNIAAGRAKRCCILRGKKERKRLKKRQIDTQNVFDLVGTIRRGGRPGGVYIFEYRMIKAGTNTHKAALIQSNRVIETPLRMQFELSKRLKSCKISPVPHFPHFSYGELVIIEKTDPHSASSCPKHLRFVLSPQVTVAKADAALHKRSMRRK